MPFTFTGNGDIFAIQAAKQLFDRFLMAEFQSHHHQRGNLAVTWPWDDCGRNEPQPSLRCTEAGK